VLVKRFFFLLNVAFAMAILDLVCRNGMKVEVEALGTFHRITKRIYKYYVGKHNKFPISKDVLSLEHAMGNFIKVKTAA
jgi:hypothetical protein